MPSIRGIAELVLNANNLPAMVEFYQSVLGFEHHSQFPFSNPTIVFLTITPLDSPLGQTHPQMLVLIDPARHPSARGKFAPRDQLRPFSLNHLAFEIDESQYESEHQRLNGLGLEPITAEFPHIRAKALFFKDPEDNALELICHDSSITPAQAQQAAGTLDEDLTNG